MSESARRQATLQDFWDIPENERFHELVGGELVEKAAPSGEHGNAQAGIVGALWSPFQRGWWIVTAVEIVMEAELVRPDVVGWRRDRCPERPTGIPIKPRPDWICEVVSPSRPTDDTVKKLRLYHRVAVSHYWLVDPRDMTLTVMRWSDAGYITVISAERGETVRAEPFEAIELVVGTLFGDDPP